MTRVRVATYNIFMGGRGGAAVDAVVRALEADVLLVNECPKTPCLWRRRCLALAERWGMAFVVGGRPAGSNMILVRRQVAVKEAGSVHLRQPPFQPRRGIAWAQLRVKGRLVGVVSCHLSLDKERRATEVERVVDVALRLRGPVVIGGDLNESPTGPSWQRLRQAGFVDRGSQDWLTFPADDPERRIDALLVSAGPRVVRHGGPGLAAEGLARASDHRPVLADLEMD